MPRRSLLAVFATAAVAAVVSVPNPPPVRAAEEKDKQAKAIESAIDRGLEYLKKDQKPDGHWEAQGGQYPTTMTALAGMCFLMEGSTLKEGKYTEQVKKAVEWFLKPARLSPDGKIGDVRNPTESTRYMYGQGFGTMFLASAYGEEDDKDTREKLEKLLKKAVEFICKAQTDKDHKKPEGKTVKIGGWGYVSANDGGNFDEGSVTITALQGLRAAKNAGIPVPKEAIDKAVNYLDACTTQKGGIIYSYAGGSGAALNGQERPPLTAAALACGLSSGEFTKAIEIMNGKNPPKGVDRPSIVRWFEYCKTNIPIGKGRQSHDEYQTYYYAQAVYALGENRYGEMFPGEPKDSWLTWGKFKEGVVQGILDNQDKNTGAWTQGYIGPVYSTSINLSILQLEKGILPIYQK